MNREMSFLKIIIINLLVSLICNCTSTPEETESPAAPAVKSEHEIKKEQDEETIKSELEKNYGKIISGIDENQIIIADEKIDKSKIYDAYFSEVFPENKDNENFIADSSDKDEFKANALKKELMIIKQKKYLLLKTNDLFLSDYDFDKNYFLVYPWIKFGGYELELRHNIRNYGNNEWSVFTKIKKQESLEKELKIPLEKAENYKNDFKNIKHKYSYILFKIDKPNIEKTKFKICAHVIQSSAIGCLNYKSIFVNYKYLNLSVERYFHLYMYNHKPVLYSNF